MLLGGKCAGKTTLLKALSHALDGGLLARDSAEFVTPRKGTAGVDRTLGIDVHWLEVVPSRLPPRCVRRADGSALGYLSLVPRRRCRLVVYDAAGHTARLLSEPCVFFCGFGGPFNCMADDCGRNQV